MKRDKTVPGMPELLSPAGSYEAACAALQYGADAIYLGLEHHSARAEAVNFDDEALGRIVSLAQNLSPRRRVYVTINTLLRDNELSSALRALETADEAGADGIIFQDLAILRLAQRHCPRLELHASTQMAIHDIAGARALAELGCTRVVLARELSLEEIGNIAAKAPIEVEVFVHGALCYSYSGLCLFSARQTGRSGNRGQCAYCCRERFTLPGARQPSHPFSMRDLSLLSRLDALRGAGVASLKIEGRMKSPLYVAAVTSLYRRKLDGRLDPKDEASAMADLQTIFSRPLTSLYLDGPQAADEIIDASATGHRGTSVGRVETVHRDRGDNTRWLCFTTKRALEKHDGLQAELPAFGRPFGFGINRMRLSGQTHLEVTVPRDSRVEIALPPDTPPLPRGTPLFCTASQEVQRRYPVNLPRDSQCRPARPIEVEITLEAGGIAARAVPLDDHSLAIALRDEGQLDKARQPEQTDAAVRQALERLGDSQWSLAGLKLNDPDGLYTPPSRLNALRRKLTAALDEKLTAQRTAEQTTRQIDLETELAAAQVISHDNLDAETAALSASRRLGLETASVPPAVATTATISAVPARSYSVKAALGMDPAELPEAVDAATKGAPIMAVAPTELVLELLVTDCRGDGAALAKRLRAWREIYPGLPIRWALPPIIRGAAETRAVETTVRQLLAEGWKRWECSGLGTWHILSQLNDGDLSLTADGALYAMNRLACLQLASMGFEGIVAPAEADAEVLTALARQTAPRAIIPIFQHPVLFISDTAPVVLKGSNPVNSSPDSGRIELSDRRGRCFTVEKRDCRWLTRANETLRRHDLIPALLAAGAAELRIDLG